MNVDALDAFPARRPPVAEAAWLILKENALGLYMEMHAWKQLFAYRRGV